MRSVLAPSLSELLASLSVPGSTLTGGQSHFPTAFEEKPKKNSSHSPQSTKMSTQTNSHTHNTTKTSHAAFSSLGQGSVMSEATEDRTMDAEYATDSSFVAQNIPVREGSNGVVPQQHGAIDSSFVGRQRGALDSSFAELHHGALDSSFVGGQHGVDDGAESSVVGQQMGGIVGDSSFAGVATDTVVALQANYDSDSDSDGGTTAHFAQLQQLQGGMAVDEDLSLGQGAQETSHFDVDSDSDGEIGASPSREAEAAAAAALAPPLRGAAGAAPRVAGLRQPPQHLHSEGGLPPRSRSASVGGTSSHQLRGSSHSLKQDPRAHQLQPHVVNYGSESSTVVSADHTSSHLGRLAHPSHFGNRSSVAQTHDMQADCDTSTNSCEDEEEFDQDEEATPTGSYNSTELDVTTTQLPDSDLRSRVYGAVSSIASQSQQTTPGSTNSALFYQGKGRRARHVFQRPVIDGSTALSSQAMDRYYNCGETGATNYQHSVVIAALKGALEDGVVTREDIAPVHNYLRPIKTNSSQIRAAQAQLSQLPYANVTPSSSVTLSPSVPSVRNPTAPSWSLPGSSRATTPAQTPMTNRSENPNTFFSDTSSLPGQQRVTTPNSQRASIVLTNPSQISSRSSRLSLPQSQKAAKRAQKVFGSSSQITPSSQNLSRLSGSRKGNLATPSSALYQPSSLPDIQEEDDFSAHGNPLFRAKFAVSASGGQDGASSSNAPKDPPLSRGLFYEPPTSSLASGRSLSTAVTQAATWATANDVIASSSAMKSNSAMSSQSLPFKTAGLSKTLSQHSALLADQGGNSNSSSKALLKKKKVQLRKNSKMERMTGGLLRCAGCTAAPPISNMGASTMGP